MKPIELYYWPTPNGWKITIALEELGLPYNLHLVDIGAGDQFKPDFLKIAPNNRMPAIIAHDGPDGEPIAIFESGAILQYLARKTGKFGGTSERNRIEVDQWLMWQMGGLGPMAGQAHHFLKYAPAMDPPNDLPYAKDRYRNETGRLYGVLNHRLEGRDYVAGEYSIADIANWCWVRTHKWSGVEIDEFKNLQRWVDAIYERPAAAKGITVPEDMSKILQEAEDADSFVKGARNIVTK